MDELQLSEELINDVFSALAKHDSRAEDPGIAVQYLSALTGYIVANMGFEVEEKREFLQQLAGFSMHVFDDVCEPEPEANQAGVGIWRPGEP